MSKDKKLNIYFSYSHKDRKYVDTLRVHLLTLEKKYNLNIFDSFTDIKKGQRWDKEISRAIEEANIILIFVSPDYLGSEWCHKELELTIQKSDEGRQTLVPIIVRESYWKETVISNYQILPRNLQPISSLRNKDKVYTELISEIDTILFSITKENEERQKVRLQVTLNMNFNEFDESKKQEILESIRKILELSDQSGINIVNKKKGSVKLILELNEEKLKLLQEAFKNGQLDTIDASGIEISGTTIQEESRRPRVFIGSSSEGLDIAEAIQLNLDHLCEVTIWSQGVFGLGTGTLETLVEQVKLYDFAILVMTPDDMTKSRGDLKNSPRDNVLFELGLFMGKIGRYRTFAVYDRTADIKIPSDLAGVSLATYHPHSTGNIDASIGAPCTRVKRIIKEFGIIENE